jgi:phosphonate degradation associated HDIG domain protein
MALSIPEIEQLLNSRATTWYGQEAVSQLEHALQCAHLAETAGETESTVVAALLHDLGHIVGQNQPAEAPVESGDRALPKKDDLHQFVALPFLRSLFPESVLEPIKLHVDAKRYLCAVDAAYWDSLSPASKHSLVLQGGAFDAAQVQAFEALPFWQEAVRLRRYDDLAKVPGAATAGLKHFSQTMSRVALAPQLV